MNQVKTLTWYSICESVTACPTSFTHAARWLPISAEAAHPAFILLCFIASSKMTSGPLKSSTCASSPVVETESEQTGNPFDFEDAAAPRNASEIHFEFELSKILSSTPSSHRSSILDGVPPLLPNFDIRLKVGEHVLHKRSCTVITRRRLLIMHTQVSSQICESKSPQVCSHRGPAPAP